MYNCNFLQTDFTMIAGWKSTDLHVFVILEDTVNMASLWIKSHWYN